MASLTRTHTAAAIRSAQLPLSVSVVGPSRAFGTSAPQLAAAKGKPAQKAPAKKKGTSFTLNKPGAPKRAAGGGGGSSSGAVLRYSEASEVPDLAGFDQFIPDVVGQSSIGRATTFPRESFNHLKSLGLPRRLDKEIERSGGPAAVIRKSTVQLAQLLDKGKNGASKDARHVLAGSAGSGKSMLLLQSAAYARESGWIVLYVPRAAEWIQSSTEYHYHSPSLSFHQSTLASNLLQTLVSVNEQALASITSPRAIGSSKAGTNLAEICRAGIKTSAQSGPSSTSVQVLEGVMDVLAAQTEVPVLLAIDEVQALFSRSEVRTPDYKVLESYHLSTPKLALDFITGKKSFAKGMILTALSHSTPSLPIPSALYQALDIPSPRPITAYTTHEPTHLANASSGLQRVDVPWTMCSEEAAGIWQIWAKKGWARGTDETFLGALSASSGNINNFTKGLARNLQALLA